MVVIEHNLDVVKSADWLIDLGPEGGAGGGRLLAEGTPEEVAGDPASHTGQVLRRVLPAAKAPRRPKATTPAKKKSTAVPARAKRAARAAR